MVGTAGFPAGATLTAGCIAAGGRKLAISFRCRGCPGCAAIACNCLFIGGGGGGGVFFATTCRFITAAGGAATWPAVDALPPSTDWGVGFAATRRVIGAAATCCGVTLTATFATGWALVNAPWGTAVTAPGTVLFT